MLLIEQSKGGGVHSLDLLMLKQHLMAEKLILDVLKAQPLVSGQNGDGGNETVE